MKIINHRFMEIPYARSGSKNYVYITWDNSLEYGMSLSKEDLLDAIKTLQELYDTFDDEVKEAKQ